MDDLPDFILFGEGNYNALGVLYQLTEIGINPLMLIVGKAKDRKKGNLIGYSKYAKRITEVGSEKEGVDWLIKNQNKFTTNTIIYPTSDIAEKFLDQNYNTLSKTFKFPNAGFEGFVSELMNKDIQINKARECGINIIESQFTNSQNFSYDKVKYPCLVKTLNSTEGSKSDMAICNDETELKILLNSKEKGKEYIIQDYIKNEKDLLFLGVAFKNEEIWIPAVVIKPGVSFSGEYTYALISTNVNKYLPELDTVKNFVKLLKYKGPFSIEFAHEKGKNYFLEINLRNDGTSHYPLGLGVNIAKAYIEDKDHIIFENKEYEMIDEIADIRRVLYKEISLKDWFKSFKNAGSYRFFRKGEIKMIIPILLSFISRTYHKIMKK